MSALTSTVSSQLSPAALALEGGALMNPIIGWKSGLVAAGVIATGNTIAQDKSNFRAEGSTNSVNAQVRPAQPKIQLSASLSSGPKMQGEGV